MGLALGKLYFDQWQWKEELKVLGLEDLSFGECLYIHKVLNILVYTTKKCNDNSLNLYK